MDVELHATIEAAKDEMSQGNRDAIASTYEIAELMLLQKIAGSVARVDSNTDPETGALMAAVSNSGSLTAKGSVVSVTRSALSFGLVTNASNAYASLCVKSGVPGVPVSVLIAFNDAYATGMESNAMRITTSDSWQVIDENAGYGVGQFYYLQAYDFTAGIMYIVRACATYATQTNRADWGIINMSVI